MQVLTPLASTPLSQRPLSGVEGDIYERLRV